MDKSGADQELVWPLYISIPGFALGATLQNTALLESKQSGANFKVQTDTQISTQSRLLEEGEK